MNDIDVLDIRCKKENDEVEINIVNSQKTDAVANTNAKANIKLFSLNGSLMMSEDIVLKIGNNLFSKTLSIPSGVYIAVVKLEGNSISQKVIK
jgi:hypothetical protein